MQTTIITESSFTDAPTLVTARPALRSADAVRRTSLGKSDTVGIDRDIAEVAIGFGHLSQKHALRSSEFATSTIAGMTYRRVDPLREPLKVADERLQSHLEALCEQLRAKY